MDLASGKRLLAAQDVLQSIHPQAQAFVAKPLREAASDSPPRPTGTYSLQERSEENDSIRGDVGGATQSRRHGCAHGVECRFDLGIRLQAEISNHKLTHGPLDLGWNRLHTPSELSFHGGEVVLNPPIQTLP